MSTISAPVLERLVPFLSKLKQLPIERFSNDCRKTKTKAITPTNHNRSKQRDEPITIRSNLDCNSLEAREKSRLHSAIGFGFGFDSSLFLEVVRGDHVTAYDCCQSLAVSFCL